MLRRFTFILPVLALASASFAQTMGDPVALITVVPAINNSPEFFATASGNVFNYGMYETNHHFYAGQGAQEITAAGSATAYFKIRRTSPVNPGALGVVIKVDTRAKTSVQAQAYYGVKDWRMRSTIQGLWGRTYLAEFEDPQVPYYQSNGGDQDLSSGYPLYEAQPDLIMQLSQSNWSEVSPNVWEAEIQVPVLVTTLLQGHLQLASAQGWLISVGDTKMTITFPGFS